MAATRLSLPFSSGQIEPPTRGLIAVYRSREGTEFGFLPPDQVTVIQTYKPAFDYFAKSAVAVATQPPLAALSIVQLTRSKAENLGNIARAASSTTGLGTIVVDGAKTDGIDSLHRHIAEHIKIRGTLSKAHGRVFWFDRPATLPTALADWEAKLEPAKNKDGYLTVPGVFSAERCDPGSAALAAHFNDRVSGRAADLGAGWGWLSVQALALGKPTSLDLFEAESLALDCARSNINDSRAEFHWADATALNEIGDYDTVIMNPPFHDGRDANSQLGMSFIAAAARLLKRHGKLLMVANRQLPYERPLEQNFSRWQVLSDAAGFKVFEATSPKSARAH